MATQNFCKACLKSYTVMHVCPPAKEDKRKITNILNVEGIQPGIIKGCSRCINKQEHTCPFWECNKCGRIFHNQHAKQKKHKCEAYICIICYVVVPPKQILFCRPCAYRCPFIDDENIQNDCPNCSRPLEVKGERDKTHR